MEALQRPAAASVSAPGAGSPASAAAAVPTVRLPPVTLGVAQMSPVASVGSSSALAAAYAGAPLSSRSPVSTAAASPTVRLTSSAVRTAAGTPVVSSARGLQVPSASRVVRLVSTGATLQATTLGLTRPPSTLSLNTASQSVVKTMQSPTTTQVVYPLPLGTLQAAKPADLCATGRFVVERPVSEDSLLASGNLVRNEALEAELRRKAGLVPGAIMLSSGMSSPEPSIILNSTLTEQNQAVERLTGRTSSPGDKGLLAEPQDLSATILPEEQRGLSPATERSPQTEPPEGISMFKMEEAEGAVSMELRESFAEPPRDGAVFEQTCAEPASPERLLQESTILEQTYLEESVSAEPLPAQPTSPEQPPQDGAFVEEAYEDPAVPSKQPWQAKTFLAQADEQPGLQGQRLQAKTFLAQADEQPGLQGQRLQAGAYFEEDYSQPMVVDLPPPQDGASAQEPLFAREAPQESAEASKTRPTYFEHSAFFETSSPETAAQEAAALEATRMSVQGGAQGVTVAYSDAITLPRSHSASEAAAPEAARTSVQEGAQGWTVEYNDAITLPRVQAAAAEAPGAAEEGLDRGDFGAGFGAAAAGLEEAVPVSNDLASAPPPAEGPAETEEVPAAQPSRFGGIASRLLRAGFKIK